MQVVFRFMYLFMLRLTIQDMSVLVLFLSS